MCVLRFGITLLVGAAAGFLFWKGKIPGGMMVGALVGAVALNICTDMAYMPSAARTAAQIAAGAFIGASVKKSDVRRMPKLLKPAGILLAGMLLLNLTMGFVLHAITDLDWTTSFFCAVPGGMSDTPIIAADMGANGGAVAMMQFFRLVAGIGVFPSLILALTKNETNEPSPAPATKKQSQKNQPVWVLLTVLIAAVFGVLGKLSGIPVGTLLFSLIATAVFKLTTDHGAIPLWLKRLAQVLSGTYIGCALGLNELLELRFLILPSFVLIGGYMVNCFLVSGLLHRCCGMTRREAMLTATPAGASDMALISGDLGISNPDLNVLQIIRMVVVISVFPQLIHLLVTCLP